VLLEHKSLSPPLGDCRVFAMRPTERRQWLSIPPQGRRLRANGLPDDTNNGQITFNAVQVSVDPCAVRVIAVHDNLMSLIPIVFTGPPQRY
jgi:hypothetical protein